MYNLKSQIVTRLKEQGSPALSFLIYYSYSSEATVFSSSFFPSDNALNISKYHIYTTVFFKI